MLLWFPTTEPSQRVSLVYSSLLEDSSFIVVCMISDELIALHMTLSSISSVPLSPTVADWSAIYQRDLQRMKLAVHYFRI